MLDIRGIAPDEYLKARYIWERCFPADEPEFIDYYFEKRTKPEYILAAFEAGNMVGALHVLPQILMLRGEKKQIGFIAGVGTLPKMRHKGIAKALLAAAEKPMLQAGCCAAVLQPFNTEFYEKCGYKPFVYRDKYDFPSGESAGFTQIHTPNAMELLDIYSRFAGNYDGMKQRSLQDFELLLEKVQICTEHFSVTKDAYALYYMENGRANIFELVGDKPLPLLQSIACKMPLTAFLPCDTELDRTHTREVFNMVRVLDAAKWEKGCEKAKMLYSLEYY